MAVITAWLILREDRAISLARPVKLGMTRIDVGSIMGSDESEIFFPTGGGGTLVRGGMVGRLIPYRDWIYQRTGWAFSVTVPPPDDWAVHIHFDSNGRVDRIKRGSEIIEAPASRP
jgi:hypothetical protein